MLCSLFDYLTGQAEIKVRLLTHDLATKTTRLEKALGSYRVSPPSAVGVKMANTALDNLTQQIQKTEGVLDSATAFVQGVPKLIQDAVNQALANGATADQLAPVTALGTDLAAKADALTTAMQANNPTPAG